MFDPIVEGWCSTPPCRETFRIMNDARYIAPRISAVVTTTRQTMSQYIASGYIGFPRNGRRHGPCEGRVTTGRDCCGASLAFGPRCRINGTNVAGYTSIKRGRRWGDIDVQHARRRRNRICICKCDVTRADHSLNFTRVYVAVKAGPPIGCPATRRMQRRGTVTRACYITPHHGFVH